MTSKRALAIAIYSSTLFILVGSLQMAHAQTWCSYPGPYGTCVSGQVSHNLIGETGHYLNYTEGTYGMFDAAGSAGFEGASSGASASLSSGSLYVYSFASTPLSGNIASADSITQATFWDTLTFSGAVSGARGTFVFQGVAESQGQTSGEAVAWANVGGSGSAQILIPKNMDLMRFTLSLDFPLDDGAVPLYMNLDAWADAGMCCTTFSGISIDPEVEFILPDGVTMTSASGVNYPTDSPVPEPSTWWMLGTGVLGLAGVIRRKINV